MEENNFNKFNLEKDIDCLKSELGHFVSSDKIYDLCDKRHDDLLLLASLKEKYKETNKSYRKNKKIKNLSLGGLVSIFLVPFVLIPTGVGIMKTVSAKKDFMNDYNVDVNKSYVMECIYENNFGEKILLDEDHYTKDYLEVETEYSALPNGGYSKNVYTFDKEFKTIEELEEQVNTNYMELINEHLDKADTTQDEVIVPSFKDDNTAKVSAVGKVYKEATSLDKEVLSGQEVSRSFNGEAIMNGFLAVLLTAMVDVVPFCVLYTAFAHKLERIYNNNSENQSLFDERKQLKEEIKQLKKKYKKNK